MKMENKRSMNNKVVNNKINSNLSVQQRAAVFSDNRNLLVTAGPGSGKTVVIVNRIVHLINEQNINPSNIIVITFTRAAAINMKNRYIAMNGKDRVPFFGTFHGLFYKILKNYYGQINIIDTLEVYKLIKNVLMSYLDEVSDEKIKEVINNISVFKTSGKALENFDSSIDKGIFTAAYNIYEQYRKERNLFDFDDLQIGCRDLFVKNYTILQGLQSFI